MFLRYLSLLIIPCITYSYSYAEKSRLLTSIVKVGNKYEAQNRINILSENIENVNQIRTLFMQKYIKAYSGSKKTKLTEKEVANFQKALNEVVNLKQVMKESKRTVASTLPQWASPEELIKDFSKEEKTKMAGYFNYFNENVYPDLKEGMDNRNKQKIVEGLKKWDANAQTYNDFIQDKIDKLQKTIKTQTKLQNKKA